MVPTDMYYDSVVLAKTRMHRSNTKCQAIQGSYLLINDIKIAEKDCNPFYSATDWYDRLQKCNP